MRASLGGQSSVYLIDKIEVKMSLCSFESHVMNTYGGMEL
jgi:hypothetical protein